MTINNFGLVFDESFASGSVWKGDEKVANFNSDGVSNVKEGINNEILEMFASRGIDNWKLKETETSALEELVSVLKNGNEALAAVREKGDRIYLLLVEDNTSEPMKKLLILPVFKDSAEKDIQIFLPTAKVLLEIIDTKNTDNDNFVF